MSINHIEAIGLIVVLNLIVYFRTLKCGLVVDDIRWREKVSKGFYKIEEKNPVLWLKEFFYRRLYGGCTFGWKNVPLDHFVSIFIHASICIMIYLAFGRNTISFWAAILYSVNPANNQTAIWLNGRRYAVNTLLMLFMILLGPVGLVLYPFTAILQVNAFFTPLLYGWLGVVALPVFLLISGKHIKDKMAARLEKIKTPDMRDFSPKKVIPIVKIYGAYFLKMIFPGRPMMIYPFLRNWGMTKEGNKKAYAVNGEFWLGISAISLTGLGLWYFRGTQMFWWFLVMFLSTFQWCGILSVTQIFADRYISLSNVFMMYFVSYFIHQFSFAPVLFTGLIVYYLSHVPLLLRMYEDIMVMYDYHIYWDPQGVKCREFKSAYLLKSGDVLAAWETIKLGLLFAPNDMKMNMMAAQCMGLIGKPEDMLSYLANARRHAYIGQLPLLEGFQNALLGINVKKEIDLIQQKKSPLNSQERKGMVNLHNRLAGVPA